MYFLISNFLDWVVSYYLVTISFGFVNTLTVCIFSTKFWDSKLVPEESSRYCQICNIFIFHSPLKWSQTNSGQIRCGCHEYKWKMKMINRSTSNQQYHISKFPVDWLLILVKVNPLSFVPYIEREFWRF